MLAQGCMLMSCRVMYVRVYVPSRDDLLQLPPEKMSDVAMFCNAYPNIELTYEMDADEGGVPAGETVVLKVLLARDVGDEEVRTIYVCVHVYMYICQESE